MKQITIYLLAIAAITLSCNSCKKETTPEFYYKCKLNGQDYTYYSCPNCLYCNILGDTDLTISASASNESIACWHNDNNGIKLGKYDLISKGNPGGGYANQPYISNYYYTDSINNGKLEITELDKVNRIVAGTFYFNAYCAKYDSTVHITEGKFRLKYTIN